MKRNCKNCDKIFNARPNHVRMGYGKCCSRECHFETRRGVALSEEFKKRMSLARIGIKHSEETKRKMRESHKGKKPYSMTDKIREKMSQAHIGLMSNENHWNWKGGKPKCKDCGQKLAAYKAIYCSRHSLMGERSSFWKGGISKEKGYQYRKAGRVRELIKKGVLGTHKPEDWLALKIKYNFMCLCCKQTEPEIKLTEDHIIPISRGGSDNIENIQPLCQKCNSRKYTKIFNYKEIVGLC